MYLMTQKTWDELSNDYKLEDEKGNKKALHLCRITGATILSPVKIVSEAEVWNEKFAHAYEKYGLNSRESQWLDELYKYGNISVRGADTFLITAFLNRHGMRYKEGERTPGGTYTIELVGYEPRIKQQQR